ncbi:flagellar biosynthetic protein FliO [Methylobacterium durans]|uniref:Flagellar biosynthesis protein FliO n=1 Tax=Methylobacterium durans TaxID=2202825 RepID=A0A2U8W9Z5_9HYPH|nr:flagellar biosynthetic protein FliO [Methylobacterium durans]AWN42142.1 hypothetical protein DK389_18585 [Methylobacterium durans]
MSAFFGSDGSFVLQFAIIFIVILAVLTGIVLVARRFLNGGGLTVAAKSAGRGRQPRLGIVDVYELDRQRQLILLRRDNVEHLLLVGGPNDVVIERHIQRGQPALRPEPMAEPPAEIEAQRAEPLFEPAFEMPLVTPGGVAGAAKAPSVTPPLDEAVLAPEPAKTEPALMPLPASPAAEEAPRRPEAAPKRPLSRTTPPLINPRPDVASERARTEPEFTATVGEPPARAAEPPVAPAVPPVSAPSEPRAIDANILSDMARQLEIALARPSSGVTPPPAQARPAPAAKAPPKPETQPASPPPVSPPVIDPMAAGMAAAQDGPVAEPPRDARSEPRKPAAEPQADAKPFLPEPPPPAASQPQPAPPRPTPAASQPPPAAPASAPAPAQKPSAANNPFSVEEIEAEFARLLGRPLDKKN